MKRCPILLMFTAFAFLSVVLYLTVPSVTAAVAVKTTETADTKADDEKQDESSTEAEADEADEESDTKDDEEAKAEAGAKNDEKKKDEDAKEASQAKSDEKKDAKTEAKKRKTHTVEPKRMKIDITIDGAFVPSEMEEVELRPESWSTFEIAEVVDHGEKVHKGETLIKFDREDIDESIEDLELAQRLNELAIMKAEEELPRMEKKLKLDLDEAELANNQAAENFERYKEIERPMAEKTAKFNVRYYDSMLNYEKDELDQLEKMYEADDLTEETEEIVLKRQRNSVEFAEFSLERAKLMRDEILEVRLPRMDIRIKDALERAALSLAQARTALSIGLNEERYKLEQRKVARRKSLDKHADLLKDRELMVIEAPADGIVFYGQHANGRWADTQTLIKKYTPHGKVSPGSVLMTIVETRPVYVASTMEESKRPDVDDGQKVRVALPAETSERIDGKVKSISTIPVSPGKFEINFSVEQNEIPDWVVPGMSCKVHITTYDKKDALVVPKAAVHDDEDDEEQKYVWLVDPDDDDAKPERRNVKIGRTKDDEIEIVKGLKKGDIVSLEDESKKDKKES